MKKDLKLKIWLFVVFLISYSILDFAYREIFHETIYQQIEVNYKDGGKAYVLFMTDNLGPFVEGYVYYQRKTGHFKYERSNDFSSKFYNEYEISGFIYRNVYVIHFGKRFVGVSKSDIESYDIKTINKSTFNYFSKLINENKIDGKIFKRGFCDFLFMSFLLLVFMFILFTFFSFLLDGLLDVDDEMMFFIWTIFFLEFAYFLFKIYFYDI